MSDVSFFFVFYKKLTMSKFLILRSKFLYYHLFYQLNLQNIKNNSFNLKSKLNSMQIFIKNCYMINMFLGNFKLKYKI